jgi:hypothetical protein
LPSFLVNDDIFVAEGDWVSRLSSGKPGKKNPRNPVNPIQKK